MCGSMKAPFLTKRDGACHFQEILGHKGSKRIEIYTHVSAKNLSEIRSPLDDILGQKGVR
jgi:hypothetical protein